MLLPALTALAGLGCGDLATGQGWQLRPNLIFPLAVLVIGPLVGLVVLNIVIPNVDWILVATATMLTAIGTATIHSLSLVPGADGVFYQAIAFRHTMFVGIGFLALILGAVLSRRLDVVRRYPFTLFAAAISLTATTMVFGQTINGARLWLRIGALQFQPSEVARLLLAAFVAIYLYDRRHLVAAPWRVGSVDLPPAPYLLPLAGAVLVAVAVLLFQNDLGMAALVVLGAFASTAAILNSKPALGSGGAIMIFAAIAAYSASPRVRDRVVGWLYPWNDPLGTGFQFVQADYGLSAGGVLGIPSPLRAVHIPEVQTDFIAIGVAGQWGLMGAVAVFALLCVLVCRCSSAALGSASDWHAFLALAVATLIGTQVLLIVGGTLRLLPLTGLTVPLVSFGGTSMIATMFALGIVAGMGSTARGNP